MKKNLFLFCIAAVFVACGPGSEKAGNTVNETPLSDNPASKKTVELNVFDGYFSVISPGEEKVYLPGKSTFEQDFNPAATMGRIPKTVDFERESVGAIVLPETEYNAEIILDSAYVLNRKMHVIYTVNKGDEKRSFSILPVKLFTFDRSIDIDSVSFEKNGEITTLPAVSTEN